MSVNEIFFSGSGLTSTSANHLANLAKEYVTNLTTELESVSFYTKSISLIGTKDSSVISEGITTTQLFDIQAALNKIADAHSLISWLREAIKARENMTKAIESMDINDWARKVGVTLPTLTTRRPYLTEDDVIASMSIKQRNHIYTLKARASVIGKYIHPDGHFSEARKQYLAKAGKNDVEGEGRDTLVYSYTPTIAPTDLENVYFELQKEYRAVQAELNGIMHDVEGKIREDKMAALNEESQARMEFHDKIDAFQVQFEAYRASESKRIADLKIIIPNDLQEIYATINSLGK